MNRGTLRAVMAVAAFSIASASLADDRLSEDGARLTPATYARGEAFERRVEEPGAELLAAHVTLRPASSNLVLTRDRDGFWAPWDGDPATLAPSAARAEDGGLVFKIFDAPPADLLPPYTITLIARTADGLRYGWFQAAPASGSEDE